MPCLLCIDIGSSSVRCSAYAILGATHRDSTPSPPPPVRLQLIHGCRVQSEYAFDADGNVPLDRVLRHVHNAFYGCLEALPREQEHVYGVGFASFAMNLVGLDADGNPVTKVFTYASHGARLAQISSQLEKIVAADPDLVAPTGTTAYHTSYAAVKLIHCATSRANPNQGCGSGASDDEVDVDLVGDEDGPAAWLNSSKGEASVAEKVARWSTVSSYIIGKWSGDMLMDGISYSEASWTGLFDFKNKTWHLPLLELLPQAAIALPSHGTTISGSVRHDKLPKPCATLDSGRTFSAALAARFPRLKGGKLFLGIADGAAANIGSSCIDSSRMLVTVGTSAAVRVMMNIEEVCSVPQGLWCYAVDANRCLLGGALTDGGSVFEWICRTAGIESNEELTQMQEEALRVTPGEHGLVVMPFLSGERSTGWSPQAKMTIAGITRDVRPADILRAGLEGVAIRLKKIVQKLSAAIKGGAETKLVCNGKALLRSQILKQAISDLVQKELFVLDGKEQEHTSLGTARKILEDTGLRPLDTAGGSIKSIQQPNPETREAYDKLEAAHDRLYHLSQAFYKGE